MSSEPQDPTDDYVTKGLRSALRWFDAAGRSAGSSRCNADAAEEPPPELPGYDVLGLIGRGGIGLVYRARDAALGRAVAIKVLAQRFAQDQEMLARFREEARICSQLQHPGVVPVHGLGQLADGRPFFTMKVIEGDTLAQRLRARRDPAQDRHDHLSTFMRVCQTIAYAHSTGVVHGDLKPSNVMVGAFGEAQVMDWGFASSAAAATAQPVPVAAEPASAPSRLLGTPAYMSPEQARGELSALTPRTDVFGLGGILTEILTGSPTYVGASRQEVCLLAARGWTEPAAERIRASGADEALSDIALRCLEKEPANRPADAIEVADLVQAWLLAGEERARALELEVDRARRLRTTTTIVAATILVAFAAVAGLALWWQHDRNEWRLGSERLVATAMDAARQLQERARLQPPDRFEHWDEALASARHAQQLAQAEASPVVQKGAQDLLLQLQTEFRGARRDQQMALWLDEIRSHLPADRGALTDGDYAAAFLEYGLDLAAGEPAAVANSIRTSPLATDLLTAIDDWARLRRNGILGMSGDWRRLMDIANRADSDPWRARLRAALDHGAVEELAALANSPDAASASASSVTLLANCLGDAGRRELAVELLRQEVQARPPDVWMLHELARFVDPKDEAGRAEVMALRMTIAAMRPQSPHLLTDFAHTLIANGKSHWAEQILQRATELEPGYTRAWRYLAWARLTMTRGQASAQAADRALEQSEGDAEAHHLRAVAASQLGDYQLARQHAERAIELGATWQTKLLLGMTMEHLGDVAGALKALDGALAESPGLAIAQVVRGNILLHAGRFAAAAEQYRSVELSCRNIGELATADRCMAQVQKAESMAAAAAQIDAWGVDFGHVPSEQLAVFAEVAWIRADALLALRLLRRLALESPTLFTAPRRLAIEVAAAVGRTEGLAADEQAEVLRVLHDWIRQEVLDGYVQVENGGASPLKLARWAVELRDGPALAPYFTTPSPGEEPADRARWDSLRQTLDELIADMTVRSSKPSGR